MGRESRSVWEKRVRRWQQSGLTAAAFAKRERVSPRTLAWWRWRLGSLSAAKAKPSFVEVVPAPDVDPGPGARIEIAFPSGVRVIVPVGITADQLRPVIAAFADR